MPLIIFYKRLYKPFLSLAMARGFFVVGA